jgi:hypothetical protein
MLTQGTPNLIASYRAKEAELISIIQSLEVSLELHKQENESLRRKLEESKAPKEEVVSQNDLKEPSNKQLMSELSRIRNIVERSSSPDRSPARSAAPVRAPLSPITQPTLPRPNVGIALESFDLATKINTSRTTSRVGSDRFGELRTLHKVNQQRQSLPSSRVEQVLKQSTNLSGKQDHQDLRALDKLMHQGGYLKMFERVGPGTYLFGSKRVVIMVKNNKIMVRNGAAFVDIEAFLSPYIQ